MAENRGKKFEQVIRDSFTKVVNTSVVRLPDPTMGYLGYANICDFIVYHYPNQYFIECKSIHGNTFPFSNITSNQWLGLIEMSEIVGVRAGLIIWFVDHDVTKYVPIGVVQRLRQLNDKSIRYDFKYSWSKVDFTFDLKAKKKRIFFDYDMVDFFRELS